jgi:hypothetical protein
VPRARTLTSLVLVAVAVATAGCGGGPSGEARAWTKGFCTAGITWRESLAQRNAQARQATVNAANLKAARRELAALFRDSAAETDRFAAAVSGLGPAPGEDGAALQERLVETIGQMRDRFTQAAQEISALSVRDSLAFDQQAGYIASAVQGDIARIGDSITTLQDEYSVPELDQAYTAEPSCGDLRG